LKDLLEVNSTPTGVFIFVFFRSQRHGVFGTIETGLGGCGCLPKKKDNTEKQSMKQIKKLDTFCKVTCSANLVFGKSKSYQTPLGVFLSHQILEKHSAVKLVGALAC